MAICLLESKGINRVDFMCGIIGYVLYHKSYSLGGCLDQGIHMLKHRGPDDKGQWIKENVGLGFRRLSIQDLSARGHQPMISEDKRFVIVFNGEIYNFKELRKSLESRGIKVRSGTDTEVLLKLYQLEREKCLDKLNGMFAMAIYDTESRVLFLARDRFGIKPLYFMKTDKAFLFASELKAFIPFIKPLNLTWELNTDQIVEYMLFRYVSGEHTLIKNVQKCDPGHYLKLDQEGHLYRKKYYEMPNRYINKLSIEEYIDLVEEEIQKSIKLRLISDAPLGIALSGGVDSSLITALARKLTEGEIKTFSIVVFPGGMILEDSGEVKIYYGSADTVECLATAQLDDLLSLIKPCSVASWPSNSLNKKETQKHEYRKLGKVALV